MGGMSLKLTPVVVRHLFGLYSLPMTAQLPHHPPHPIPFCLPTHPLIHATHDITVAMKKVAQNPAVLAS